jgi:prophage regulatory protein
VNADTKAILPSSEIPPNHPDDRLIDLHEVRRLTGVGKTTIYALIADGAFPRPFRLPCRASRWSLQEVLEWKSSLPRAGIPGSPDCRKTRRRSPHG